MTVFKISVTMKLDSGTQCIVLEKGEEQNIKGDIDFWYKIKFNDTTAWVFGSQTSLKTGQKESEEDKRKKLVKIFKRISKAIRKKEFDKLKPFFYKNKVVIITNPGAYTVGSFTDDLSTLRYRSDYYPECELKFETWPEYQFNEDEEGWNKNGCFAEEIKGTGHFISLFEATHKYLLIDFSA